MKAQIYVNNRDYTDWEFKDVQSGNTIKLDDNHVLKSIHPLSSKLFSRDILSIDENGEMTVSKSILKNTDTVAGVLILEGNKTYGRANNKKLLYKCIPDDRYLPAFLIQFAIRKSPDWMHYCFQNQAQALQQRKADLFVAQAVPLLRKVLSPQNWGRW